MSDPINVAALNQTIERLQRKLAEARVLSKQWAEKLIIQYQHLPDGVKAKLPPFPYTTAESVFPSLFAEEYHYAQYVEEANKAEEWQRSMLKLIADVYAPRGSELLK